MAIRGQGIEDSAANAKLASESGVLDPVGATHVKPLLAPTGIS